MLHVTPVQVQVETTVRRTLKMFESELQTHNIKIEFKVGPSYEQEGIDWVYCDPVRLTQIFINLLTNVSWRLLVSLQCITFGDLNLFVSRTVFVGNELC